MSNNQDYLNLLRKINSNSETTQRKLAAELGFSLGKLNYCLKSLQDKGLVKLENFKTNPNKLRYLKYIVTPKGIKERIKLTLDFMNRKSKEYNELESELKLLNNNFEKSQQ